MIEELLIELLPTQEAKHIKAGNAAAVQAINAIEEANRELTELFSAPTFNWAKIRKYSAKRTEAIDKYLQLINE